MNIISAAVTTLAFAALAGCATTPNAEKGPNRTIAYYMQVKSSTPGITIETNNVYAGQTPLTLMIFGDRDGTFHNFGCAEYTIRALPLNTNQFLQTQTFRTTSKSSPGARIPGLVFFEMNARDGSFSLDVLPEK